MRRVASYIVLGLFLSAFIASAVLYSKRQAVVRRILYYPSYDSDLLCAEARYLPANPLQGDYNPPKADAALFLDELLLGPMTNRYKRIFPRGTKALYCFEKGATLYVGVSEEALQGGEGLTVREAVDLLRLNIVKNFTYLNKIDVSIDSKSAFEE